MLSHIQSLALSRGSPTYTDEEFEALLRKARQAFNNRDMVWDTEEAVRLEKEAHERSIKEWEARIAAQTLSDHQAIPRGPPPAGTSSVRALPDVHAALRQNDPSMAAHSQPVVKKAPPSMGRPLPPGFYSDKEPPRIGIPVQPHHQRHHVQRQPKARIFQWHPLR